MEEAQKLQEELKTKHAAYTAKDSEFKKAVAEYQEKQKQIQETMKMMEIQFNCNDDMA